MGVCEKFVYLHMNLYEIFIILVVHYFADFIMQTNYQAKNKSKNIEALISHTGDYTAVWYLVGVVYMAFNMDTYNVGSMSLFLLFTFVIHTLTDYITSRITSYYHKRGNTRKFFWVIGADQILHYAQLFICYQILFK